MKESIPLFSSSSLVSRPPLLPLVIASLLLLLVEQGQSWAAPFPSGVRRTAMSTFASSTILETINRKRQKNSLFMTLTNDESNIDQAGATSENRRSNDSSSSCIVANARMAAGLESIFLRCASTDNLAVASTITGKRQRTINNVMGDMDIAILQRAGMILDLRSPSERKESQAQHWMNSSSFVVQELSGQKNEEEEICTIKTIIDDNPRLVIRLDLLSPTRFMQHLEDNWLSSTEQMQANLFKIIDGAKLHRLRMKTLNDRGLLGLNEVILETGKEGLCLALKAITLHCEKQLRSGSSYDLIVIHCVQGKDRTGLLVMLCQALMGVSDEAIIEDYHKSHNARRKQTSGKTSAAMERATSFSKQQEQQQQQSKDNEARLDRDIFYSAPREIMQSTLEYLRAKYGSVAPDYTTHIGFDALWQERFQQAYSKLETAAPAKTRCDSSTTESLRFQSKL